VSKVRPVTQSGDVIAYEFHCPGCGHSHMPYVKAVPNGLGGMTPAWQFNGDLQRPTFHPSVLAGWGDESGPHICHSFVREGRIEFLPDCTHALAGKTVELPDHDHP
jgi:hypothetical protein